jgi:hypothetical protein
MAGSSQAMTEKRKVADARRPTTANAIRAKIGEGLERILKPRKIFKKKSEEGNNAAPSVFRWLGALIAPQPKRAVSCPAIEHPLARGFFWAARLVWRSEQSALRQVADERTSEASAVRSRFALFAALIAAPALAETPSPEADACKASGLIALKQKSPQVKDIQIDLDSARIINADTKIEDVPIRTIVIGEAYIERAKSEKPQTFVCIIGDKGKVLLTVFSDK